MSVLPSNFRGGIVALLGAMVTIGFLVSSSVAETPAARDGPRYYAFLFANSDYENIRKIDSAKADLLLMSGLLKNLGYQIWPLIDGDGQIRSVKRFYEYMGKAREELGPDDVIVIYYSGHGFSYGYQNWLVPLDYSDKEHAAQYLHEDAIGLTDVLNGLAAKRIDFVTVFLDSCRTTVSFPLKVGGADTVASTDLPAHDTIVPPEFNYTGPSILGTAFGVPVQAGGQAFGGDSATVPSLFTGILAQVLGHETVLGKAYTELRITARNLIEEGKIDRKALSPQMWGTEMSFDLNPRGESNAEGRTKRQWQQTVDRPSRTQMGSFLMAYPGTGRSKEAWAYIDSHPNEPTDNGGHSAVDAVALDVSYEKAASNGMLVAVAVPPPNINFPRETVITEADKRRDFNKVVVFGNNQAEIAAGFKQRYAEAGSRNEFTIKVLQDVKRVVANQPLDIRDQPSFTSPVANRIGKSATFDIGEVKIGPQGNGLFVSVEPSAKADDFMRGFGLEERMVSNISAGVPVAPGSSPKWTDALATPVAAPGFNIIGRALTEAIFDQAAVDDPGGSGSIGSKTREIVATAQSVKWAVVNVNFSPVDISEMEKELSQTEDETLRSRLRNRIAVTIQENAQELAAADLMGRDARNQLIEAGIDGRRISIVKDRLPDVGRGVRIRYFGYPG